MQIYHRGTEVTEDSALIQASLATHHEGTKLTKDSRSLRAQHTEDLVVNSTPAEFNPTQPLSLFFRSFVV
jgi:uncharacterized protein YjdB